MLADRGERLPWRTFAVELFLGRSGLGSQGQCHGQTACRGFGCAVAVEYDENQLRGYRFPPEIIEQAISALRAVHAQLP